MWSFELATFRIQEPRSSRLSWPVVAYDYEPFANDADAAVALPRLDVSCRSARIRRELRGDARWSRSMASVSPRNPVSCFWSRPKVGSTSTRRRVRANRKNCRGTVSRRGRLLAYHCYGGYTPLVPISVQRSRMARVGLVRSQGPKLPAGRRRGRRDGGDRRRGGCASPRSSQRG